MSIENARANLDAEAGAKSFDEIVAEAQQAWEEKLSLIKIQGGTEKQRTIFYTALYRVFQMPTVFNDANGEYLGFDRQVHQTTDFQYFTDLSLWDTFRTTHPLYMLIAPRDQRDMVVSLIKMLEQGGWLPRWPSGHGYSNSMLGTPADIVIAETYLKGIRDFEVEKAYQAMRRTALGPTPPGAAFSGREGVEHYLKHGYCPVRADGRIRFANPGIRLGRFGHCESGGSGMIALDPGTGEMAGAGIEAQARMREHGYVRNLKQTAENLGAKVRDYRLLDYCGNPLNPSGLILIEKPVPACQETGGIKWRCPLTHMPLLEGDPGFYSPATGIVYPVLGGIPLLRSSHEVVASAFEAMNAQAPGNRR